jgi:glycosyltransferase involved in cell wall biosynthesis
MRRQPGPNAPLRTHFVVTSLPVGGAELLLLNLIRKLDRQTIAPEVVCLKSPGELGSEIRREVPLRANQLKSKWDITVLPRLVRHFHRKQADAVITVGAGDKMFWGRLAARLAGVPVICSALHSTGWPDGVGRLNRMLSPITDGFIACAKHHAWHLVEIQRFPKHKVFRIPNGVDTQRFRPDPSSREKLRRELGVPSNAPLVGIVAALRLEKNHMQFVEAAKQVLRHCPETHFVIVGDGPERVNVEVHAAELGIVERVHMLGTRNDTPYILPGLDVFCLTSRNEANPVSILEALACEVPVVSADVGSVHETVISDQTGILTVPLAASETASAITQLLQDRDRAERYGREGRRLVQKEWSLDAMVTGYEDLIQRLYHKKVRGTSAPSGDSPVEAFSRSNELNQVVLPLPNSACKSDKAASAGLEQRASLSADQPSNGNQWPEATEPRTSTGLIPFPSSRLGASVDSPVESSS